MLPDDPATILVIIGVVLIVFGLLLVLLAKVWHDNYETGGHDPNHVRPKKMEPWHVEPSGERPIVRHHHRLNGAPDEGTRRLWPTTTEARARVIMIGADDGDNTGEAERVRPPQDEDVKEEGGEDRERGQDESGPVPDGEEGSEDARPARTLAGWFYVAPTDTYVLLDSAGDLVTSMRAERWETERGAAAKDLFVQGLPMIPDDAPYHVVKPTFRTVNPRG